MSGTVLAQIISFSSLILLQKYFFDKADFANFAWFFFFVNLFATSGALRLDTGIVLEKTKRTAQILTELAIKLMLISSVLGLMVALVGRFINPNFDKVMPSFGMYLLIPIAILSLGILQILSSWFTREESFKTLATNKLIQSSSTVTGQFTMGLSKITSVGLIIGKTIGATIASIVLFSKYKKDTKTKLFSASKSSEKELLVKHKDFIFFTTPGTFLGALINFVFLDLFMKLYGDNSGDVSAASIYLGIGFAIVSASFAQVFYSKVAKIDDKQKLRKFYTYWMLRLAGIAVLGILFVQVIPNSWMILILGEKWSDLLPTMRIMSIWMGVMFVSSALSYIYIKLNQQRTLIIFDLVHLAMVYGSIHFSYEWYHDFNKSLIWFTIAQSLFYTFTISITYYFIKIYKPNRTSK